MKRPIIFTIAVVLLVVFTARTAGAQVTPQVNVDVAPAAFNPGTGGTVIGYSLAGLTDPDVAITVTNNNGVVMRAWDAGIKTSGQFSLPWDGKDDQGVAVPQGTYTVNVSALTLVPPVQSYVFQLSVPATAGKPGTFYYPYCVATDANGNIYITDDYHHCVQKFDRNGKFLLKWGSLGTGFGQFKYPAGIAVDSGGNVYVADTGNNRVQKFDGNGKYLAQWGGSGTGSGKMSSPYGLAIDIYGNVLVADAGNARIQRFSATGVFQASWGTAGTGYGQFQSPSCIAVAPDGRIYVTDSRAMRVQVFSAAGACLARWGTYGSGNGQFNTPYGIAVDNGGKVYVADGKNNRVQVFDLDGKYLGKWGQTGSGNGQFNIPVGVALTGSDIIVVDCWNHRFQIFSPGGASGQYKPAIFSALANVIVDNSPPVITLTTPASSATYSMNQKVQASWTATDSLSGIRTSSGTVASSSYIDTSKAGSYSFTVLATDNADNTASLSRSYTVTGTASPPPATGPTVQFTCSSGTSPTYNVELARTSAQINRGLMYRTSLAENAGMLFIFGGNSPHYFYMKNTYIPLDMVYISINKVVVGIVENAKPLDAHLITPPGPSCYVLEINGGQCAQKGIRKGDTVKITGV